MIVSRAWLQKYVDVPLPDVRTIAEALTFHAFEIESAEGDILDVKVLPNRAADCLSHRGVAREIAAILDLPPKPDLFRLVPSIFSKTSELVLTVEDARACRRHMGALIRGVKVGSSPTWLRSALESVGQRSINNIVDATNYVMLDLGQPSHAFDAGKIIKDDGAMRIEVRTARKGENITLLSGESLEIPQGVLVIGNTATGEALDIAGVKGGAATAITETTSDLFLSAANFDGTMIRRASQKMKLFTEAGKRFQNDLSPEFPAYGMQALIALILNVAGGELIGVSDFYPAPIESIQVPCSLDHINHVLGNSYSGREVKNVLHRLGIAYKKAGEDFTIDPPWERRDLLISEDIVEEVGRILGYDHLPAVMLPEPTLSPDQNRFRGTERMKDQLIEQGFSEVSTQSFGKKGDLRLKNPLDISRPYLRTSLAENLADALQKARQYAPLILSPGARPKLFEVGTVFPKEDEYVELRMTETVPAWGKDFPTHDNLSLAKLEEYGKDYEPLSYELGTYEPFSAYPFIVRDVACWAPPNLSTQALEASIIEAAGPFLLRTMIFDQFEKEGRTSYGFRLVFQSYERTLTDEEANVAMERIYEALRSKGCEIR